MNPALLKQGFSIARDIYSRVNEYRAEKQREAYDALQQAAENFDAEDLRQRSQTLLDDSRREAGKLTQAAHLRLDKAREDLANRAQDASKQVEKRATAVADKATGKEAKRKKRRQTVGRVAGTTGILALLAAIAAAVYYFVFGPGKSTVKKDKPGTTPPRVEEHSGEKESTLVYSTSTENPAGPLGEDPADRDEELLGSIDEQLQTLADDGGEQIQPEDHDQLGALQEDGDNKA